MTTYRLEVDDELWERFKETVPRSTTINDRLTEFIREEVGEE